MADKDKSGIELLRELANDVSHNSLYEILKEGREDKWGAERFGGSVKESLLSISGRIEREHAEELAAKRDLTDEARAVVERLRAIDDGKCTGADRCWEILIEALGADSRRYGAAASWQYDMSLARDRLIELIENGGKQDADVAALRELADELDAKISASYCRECLSPRYNDGMRRGIGDAPERIRKAVEGAPKPDAEREVAADWVDKHGGLDEAKARMKKYYGITHRVLEALGLQAPPLDDQSERIMAELDKRLMPPGMEWPRFEDGEKVLFGDVAQDNSGDAATVEAVKFHDGQADVIFRIDCRAGTLLLSSGERVKRPDPEVLGADGLPIKAGETVYLDDAHADMAGKSGSEYYGKCGLAGVAEGEALTVSRFWEAGAVCVKESVAAWCPASWLTHTLPDTQARIDEDKRKSYVSYWGCLEHECCDCPATVDGKTPDERYGVVSCAVAQGMDIARRQRELDAMTKGGGR